MYVNNSQQKHSDIGSVQTGSSKTKSTHKNYKQTYTKLRQPDKMQIHNKKAKAGLMRETQGLTLSKP